MTAVSTDDVVAPDAPQSTLIRSATFARHRYHQGTGDMWPHTWALDGNIYTAAGDNRGSPMNVWRISGAPRPELENNCNDFQLDLVDDLPLDPKVYATNPLVDGAMGLKPAGLIDIGGRLHLAVQSQNYGTDPSFNRQTNVEGWIITSDDHGRTWNREATDQRDFLSGRVASAHFLQYGQGAATPDGWLYVYFPGASDDGNSYWENGDYVLLGRVRPERVLDRSAWEFFVRPDVWSSSADDANPIFSYFRMTGENHVSYNAGLGRYLMGNYSFLDEQGQPRPYHQGVWPSTVERSQLTLFESPTPWGPWSLFHRNDRWYVGGYQPSFPVNWMSNGGRTMYMIASGSFEDYNLCVQRLDLTV
jgi:hypothetical protein